MDEGCGGVALDEEVAIPTEAIAEEGGGEEEGPAAEEEGEEEAEEGGEGAGEVPTPGCELRVLVHVEGPELLQAPAIHALSLSLSARSRLPQLGGRESEVETKPCAGGVEWRIRDEILLFYFLFFKSIYSFSLYIIFGKKREKIGWESLFCINHKLRDKTKGRESAIL